MRPWLVFGTLAAWALALGAQEPSPQTSFGESIDVRVVNVEAVVTDAKGNRVRGLTAKDFQLEVDGREVPVEFFAEISGGEVTRPMAESGTPAPAAPAEAQARNILVFIDDIFSVGNHRDTVLAGVEKDLKLLGPEDRMAIVALGMDGRPEVLSRWTGDRAALAAVLKAARKRRAWGNDVASARRSQQDTRELIKIAMADGDLSVYDGGDGDLAGTRGMTSLLGLDVPEVDSRLYSRMLKIPVAVVATMQSLAPPPGRKILFLVSGGWPIARLMVPLFVEANRLGYTAYPVDVQGIDMVIAENDATLKGPGGNRGGVSPLWERGVHDGIELLARMTGGKALLNSARLNALGRTVEDTGSFYWLGFTPSWKGDDRHHRIEVKARGKGLAVRSRKGYSDVSRATQASLTGYGALLLGGDPKDKRLGMEMDTPENGPDSTMTVPVAVAIPVADLTAVEQDGRWIIEAVLALGAVDKHRDFSDYIE
ncbi:MAG TPA: VWA domain-containing protein, partial [Thermoanaerobaculia bacterium]|nr:VWA domain-containing protein [Thermoanaerobaculia bacterium]